MRYKLLVVDIDGTLLNGKGHVSAEDKRAINKARRAGIIVSLSTGRAAQSCLPILKRLGLDGYHVFFDGALVWNPESGDEVYADPLDSEVVKEAVDFIHRNDIDFELYSVTHYFIEHETWATDIHRGFFNLQPTLVDFTDLWRKERLIKGGLITRSPQEAAKVRNFYINFEETLKFSVARSPAYPGVEFTNVLTPDVSKGKALEALVGHLGIPLGEVAAIGDGTNDIPLLSIAGLSFAMENAPDEVKAVAKYVTLDVDHSGLAAAINRFLL